MAPRILIDPTEKFNPSVKADGWDGSGVNQIPFRDNDGQFTVTAGMSFAPFAEIPFTILETGATLRLTQNLPQITASASLHTSVTRTCDSIGPNDLNTSPPPSSSAPDISDSWGVKMFAWDVPLAPTLGVNTSTCFVLSDDGTLKTNSTVNVNTTSGLNAALNLKPEKLLLDQSAPSKSLSGIPASTGTTYPAASALPTWNMSGIESYYSANGKLPTNVNYGQMVMATSVPSGIQKAVQSVVAKESSAVGVSGSIGGVWACMGVIVGLGVFLV